MTNIYKALNMVISSEKTRYIKSFKYVTLLWHSLIAIVRCEYERVMYNFIKWSK